MMPLCSCAHLSDAHALTAGRCEYCDCSEFKLVEDSPETWMMRELVELAMQRATRELSDKGGVTPFFLWRAADDAALHYYPIPAQHVEIMNSGAGKEALFAVVREWIRQYKPSVFAICTDAWRGRMTAKTKGMALGAVIQGGFHAAVERGMLTKEECLHVTVQTPRRAMTAFQSYQRIDKLKMILYGEYAIVEGDVDMLGGRQKMFGDLRPENSH